MKQILIPTDFSAYSINAAKYALHIAAKCSFDIHLFHCYHIPAVDPMMPGEFIGDLSESMKNDSTFKLQDLQKDLNAYAAANNLKVNIAFSNRIGFAVEEITAVADEMKPVLVVIGSHHLTGFQKFITGSIIKPLIENLQAPAMVIPENASFTDKQFKILYATDFSEADTNAIHLLLEIFKPFNASVECVHFDVEGTAAINEFEMTQLEHHFKEKAADDVVHFKILKTANAHDGLQQYVAENKIDIVSTFSRKRNFLQKLVERSFSKSIAVDSNLPLVIIKQGE
jgi:nucleotide-binding universal stress UspA family protein